MPAALTAEKIAQIQKLAAGGTTLTAIARQLKVSMSTVHKYAPAGSFDRTATAAAVKAHQIDAAARRDAQGAKLLDLVDDLLDRSLTPYEHVIPAGAEGQLRRWTTPRPPAKESADLVRALATASAAELRLADHKTRDNHDDAENIVLAFDTAVKQAYDAMPPAT